MKKSFLLALFTLLVISSNIQAQSIKEGRVVYSFFRTSVDQEMIDQFDPDILTSKEEKIHTKWKERLHIRLKTRILEVSKAEMEAAGIDVQPKKTILKVQNKLQNELSSVEEDDEYFPNMAFPKKVLKKRGESADVGEHFLSFSLNFYKPRIKKLMKGYRPVVELKVKQFNKKGELIKKFTKEAEGPTEMFYISLKNPYKLDFNKLDDASIDWIFEEFGEAFDKVIKEAVAEML